MFICCVFLLVRPDFVAIFTRSKILLSESEVYFIKGYKFLFSLVILFEELSDYLGGIKLKTTEFVEFAEKL